MSFRRACSVAAAVLAAFVLTGCFVVSKNMPAGMDTKVDERLIGTWQGIDADGKEPDDVFLHFQKPEENAPLRLIWVEDRNYQVYEVTTGRAGNKNVFAAKIIHPLDKAAEDKLPLGYYLGFYEVAANGTDITFRLLEAEKVGALIKKGVLKGNAPARKYDMAELTGSPAEIAKFLASPDAAAAVSDEPAHLRRLPPYKK